MTLVQSHTSGIAGRAPSAGASARATPRASAVWGFAVSPIPTCGVADRTYPPSLVQWAANQHRTGLPHRRREFQGLPVVGLVEERAKVAIGVGHHVLGQDTKAASQMGAVQYPSPTPAMNWRPSVAEFPAAIPWPGAPSSPKLGHRMKRGAIPTPDCSQLTDTHPAGPIPDVTAAVGAEGSKGERERAVTRARGDTTAQGTADGARAVPG